MPDIYTIRFLLIFVILSLFTSAQLMAQQLPQINYQGVARKVDGSPVIDQAIMLRLTIRDGGANSTSVYSETRQLTTNKFGLFTVVIGSTGALSQNGTMTEIVWSTGNKFLQVEIDPQGGNSFVNMGTSQLQSVPYAIYAATASPTGKAEGDLSGSYPNPTVSKLQGSALSTVAPVNGQILKWNGTAWTPSDAASAIGTISGNLPITSTMQSGNATLSISKADAVTDGYLNKTDWLIFNGKATTTYVDAAILTNSNALAAETTRATTAEASKENVANKSTDGTFTSNSDLKYPTEKATKTYVDAAIVASVTPDASISTKGKIQLAGDLTGTSDLPVIADGKITTAKILDANVTDAKIAAGISASKVGLGNVDNTSDLLKPVSIATQTALDAKASNTDLALKAPLASPAFTGTVSGITAIMVGLGNVDNTSDANKPVSTATQIALDAKASNADLSLKAPLASPAFTGTVSGITATMVGLGNADNTSDANKPVSTATQTALDAKASNSDVALKAPLASPTFTGTVSGITKSMVDLANVDNTTDANKPVSIATQTALDTKASNTDLALKAPLASPTFTGTVAGISKSMVGLANADNTSDANKPVSTATQTALDTKASNSDLALKAPLASPTFTGTVSGITATMVGLGNIDNTSDANKPVSAATQTALDAKASNTDLALKAPLASPVFTGTVSGITKSMVGLANVDNTTDLLKPVSTATQTALDLKAPLASPTFTGTVSGITKSMVDLANVDNTTDLLKPVSTATQTALDLKAPLASPTFTGTVSGITKSMVDLANVDNTTDLLKPVSTATQTALDAKASNSDVALKAPIASPTFTGTVSGITATMVGLGNVDNTSDATKNAATVTLTNKTLTNPVISSPTGIVKADVGLSNVDNTSDASKPVSTATQSALALKAPLASPTFTGTVSGISKAMVGLANIDNTTDLLKPISTATQTALDAKASNSDVALKAPLASPTFTGTVSGITATMVGLGNVDNTSDATKNAATVTLTNKTLTSPVINSPTGIVKADVGLSNVDNTSDASKPVSTATQSALDLKAPLASPTFTGTVSGISKSMVGLGNVDNTSDATKNAATVTLTNKTLTSPVINSPTGIVKADVGLSNVDNTSDASKPVSTATQSALDLKAPLASPTFTGTVSGISKSMVGLGNVDNTSDATKNAATVTLTNKTLTSPVINSPTGIVKADVGLTNVDNTSDASKPVSTATQSALDLKAPLASPTFTGTVSGITKSMIGLGNVDNTSDATKNAATVTLTNKTLTSPVINSPTGIVKADVGLTNVDNTSDASKPVSTATQSALDLKAPLASPTFTGTISGITATMVGLGNVDNTSDATKNAATVTLTNKTLTSPVINSPTGIVKADVGLSNVDNTSDASKPVSTATQLALDLKAPLASPTFTGTVSGISKSMVGLANVDNTTDLLKPVSTATQTALDAKASNSDVALKAPIASPTFTGTVSGISKSMVGLANVDNTTDLLKPVSTATQTALDAKASNSDVALKAPLASPTFTGTVSGISKSMVGLANVDNTSDATKNAATVTLTNKTLTSPVINSPTGIVKADIGLTNVDNTSDASKPVSTATQSALDLKAPLASPTFTGTVSGISKSMVGLANVDNTSDATKNAATVTLTNKTLTSPVINSPTGIVKADVGLTNVDNTSDASKPVSTATQSALDLKAPLASPTFTGTVSGISKSMVGLANVDNTTDLLKPVSTATQTALDLKANSASPTFTGSTTVSGSLTGGNAEASTLAGFSANINTQTGTSYILTTADNGKIITLSNAGAITLTVPTLYAGFNCMIVQTGAGQVTISASGVTVNNRNSYTKTAGTNAIATLIALTGTSFISSGDMSN